MGLNFLGCYLGLCQVQVNEMPMILLYLFNNNYHFSGEFSQVGVQIEELTGKVWDNCFQPVLNKVNCLIVF